MKKLYEQSGFSIFSRFLLAAVLLVGVASSGWGQYDGTGSFNRIYSIEELTDGYYVIVNSGNEFAMNNTNNSNYFEHTAISSSMDKIIDPSSSIVWEIKVDGAGKTIYNEESNKYVALLSDNNRAYAVDEVDDQARWTITYESNLFVFANVERNTRALRFNSNAGQERFACYLITFGQNLHLYKYQPPPLVLYEFTGNLVNPTEKASNIIASDFQISSGSVSFGSAASAEWGGSGTPYAQGIGDWDATDAESAKFFHFTIEPEAFYELSLTELSFDYRATGAGPDNMTVTIDGVTVGEVIDFEADNVFRFFTELTGFDEISESIEVRIKGWGDTGTGGGHFRVNDVRLGGEVKAVPTLISDESDIDGLSYVFGNGPSASQSFELSGINLDGTNVIITAPDYFEVSENETTGFGPEITLTAYGGTETKVWVRLVDGLDVYEYLGSIEIVGGGAEQLEVSVLGRVFYELVIPYTNSFRSNEDYDSALDHGFVIENANQELGADGYLRISLEGYLESPTIDFTQFDFLEIEFYTATWGTGSDRELSLMISNDDGENYVTFETFSVTASDPNYDNHIVVLDLTDVYDVESGRFKVKMTDGSGRIRFRDLEIERGETLVSNIGDLRDGETDGTIYKLTGEAFLTFQSSFRNHKYIQDATGAIQIDDEDGIITTEYNLYDGIEGIVGTLTTYNNMLRFVPLADPGPANSIENVLIPEVISLDELSSDNQAQLVQILNVFIDPNGDANFVSSKNYSIEDTEGNESILRTHYNDVDYIDEIIPEDLIHLTGVIKQFGDDIQIIPRSTADFEFVPVLSAVPELLDGFFYFEGDGPSDSQSFEVSGKNLDPEDGTVTISATGSDYEVSLDDITFGETATINYTGGEFPDEKIFVRLKAGLAAGSYDGQELEITGGDAATVTITLDGDVYPAPATLGALGYTEVFDGFAGAGFSPNPAAGQLHSGNWRITGMSDGDGTFGGIHTTGDFARGSSTGGVTTGGTYAFDVGGGVTIFGVQPTGNDFTPGQITLKLENTTGEVIENISVSYDIYVYNDQDRSNSFNFAYSTDDLAYTHIPAMDYTTPEAADAPPEWETIERSTVITGLNIADGDFIYLQWQSDDVGGSGWRDEFGLTNISIESKELIVVNDIETLRGGTLGWLYKLDNQATFIGGVGFRNTKFFQDDSGFGIQIDDPGGTIQTSYNIGDNIEELVGTLQSFEGQLQLRPVEDPGGPVTIGNIIVPLIRTLDELGFDDQSRLIEIKNAEFVNAGGNFGGGGSQTNITDPSPTAGSFKNVFGTPVTGQTIPSGPVNITGVIQQDNDGIHIASRNMDDFEQDNGTIINENTGQQYATLQDAVDNATPGDKIKFVGEFDDLDASGSEVILSPGTSSGCATFTDTFTLNSTETLEIIINGYDPCDEYSRVEVGTDVTLGDANLDVILGFAPSLGDEFVIMTYGTIVGEFAQEDEVTAIYDGLIFTFSIDYDEGNVTIEVSNIFDPTAIPIASWAIILPAIMMLAFVVRMLRKKSA